MNNRNITLSTVFGSLMVANSATANKIDVEVDIESQYTDNASYSINNPNSERQDRFSLSAIGEYKNSWFTADINYRLSQLIFDKDTQDDRLELDGTAEVLVGAEDARFNITINNSKRQVLGNAGDIPSADNYQTRDVTSILPRFNILNTDADRLAILGIYSAVNYDQNQSTQNSFDSTSSGVELSWRRSISRVDSITLYAEHLDIDYDDLPNVGYQYQSARLKYNTALRQLSYSIALGYNTVDPEVGQEDGSLQWEVSANYDSGTYQISFLSEAYLTDPSRGNQNSILEDGLDQLALGNGSTSLTDQYDRQAHTFSYTTSQLCKLCTLTVTASYATEEYNVQTNQDNSELFAAARGSYQLSRVSEVGLELSRQEADYNTGSIFPSYSADTFALNYSRRLASNMDIRLRISTTERDGESLADSYREMRVALGFSYRFE